MQLLDLEDILSRLDDVKVELVPRCQGGQSGPRDVSQGTEERAAEDQVGDIADTGPE